MSKFHALNAPEGVTVEFVTTSEDVGPGQPPTAIAAAITLGTIVFLAMSSAPIMLGALVEAGRLTNATLGRVATLEMLGIAAASMLLPTYLRRGRIRLKLIGLSLALVALNIACCVATTGLTISILRGLCGLDEGGLLAAVTLVLTYTRNPEGMNGYFLGISAVPQVASTYLLTTVAVPKYGPSAGFILLAITGVVGVIAALGVSEHSIPKVVSAKLARGRWGGLEFLALFTVLLQNSAVGAGFNYVVQLATQHHVPDPTVGLAMAGLQAAAVIGALAVGWIGWRLPYVLALTVGCLAQAGVALGLGLLGSPTAYLIGCCLYGLLWNALLPFGLKLLISLDPTRRLALMNAPISLAGLGVGPLIASLVVRSADVAPAYRAAGAMFAAAAGLYLTINLAVRAARRG